MNSKPNGRPIPEMKPIIKGGGNNPRVAERINNNDALKLHSSPNTSVTDITKRPFCCPRSKEGGSIKKKHKRKTARKTAKKTKGKKEKNSRKWSKKYKDSINCKKPKGFSQRQHCLAKSKEKKVSRSFQKRKCMKTKTRKLVGGVVNGQGRRNDKFSAANANKSKISVSGRKNDYTYFSTQQTEDEMSSNLDKIFTGDYQSNNSNKPGFINTTSLGVGLTSVAAALGLVTLVYISSAQ